MDRENLFYVHGKLAREARTGPVGFDQLFRPRTFLSKFSLVEMGCSFYLFRATFGALASAERIDLLEATDFIYCSIFQRFFDRGRCPHARD